MFEFLGFSIWSELVDIYAKNVVEPGRNLLCERTLPSRLVFLWKQTLSAYNIGIDRLSMSAWIEQTMSSKIRFSKFHDLKPFLKTFSYFKIILKSKVYTKKYSNPVMKPKFNKMTNLTRI